MEKRPFTLLHCWSILKDEPKWMDHSSNKQVRIIEVAPIGSNIIDLDPKDSFLGSTTSKQHLGQDASKGKTKKARSSSITVSSSDEYLAKMDDLSLQRLSVYQTTMAFEQQKAERDDQFRKQQLEIEQQKLAIERERLERQKRIDEKAEEERILAIDMSICNPAQRAYYKKLQQQILSKIQADMSNIE
jgi:hypothetical protein